LRCPAAPAVLPALAAALRREEAISFEAGAELGTSGPRYRNLPPGQENDHSPRPAHLAATNGPWLVVVLLGGGAVELTVKRTVAVVGYAAAGLAGGLLAAAVAFTPSFAFILLGASRFDRLRGSQRASAFLGGAGPAAIGAIGGSAIPLARVLAEPWQYAVLAGAAVLLLLLLLLRLTQRQPHSHGRAAGQAPRDGDGAALRLGYRADDREAEAEVMSAVSLRTGCFGSAGLVVGWRTWVLTTGCPPRLRSGRLPRAGRPIQGNRMPGAARVG
jgi:Chromate transporter